MGIYNQHFVDRLPMNKTPVEHLKERFDGEDYQSIRNRLGKYGLEGHAHEVVMRDLSGGQKARVVFVELSLQKPHILLLGKCLCDKLSWSNVPLTPLVILRRAYEQLGYRDNRCTARRHQRIQRWSCGCYPRPAAHRRVRVYAVGC